MLFSLVLLNGSNFLLHILLGRLLGPSEYGALAALLAVFMVFSVPVGIVQTVVAKRTAGLLGAGRHAEAAALASGATKAHVAIGTLALLLGVAASPAIASFLHVGSATAALLGPYTLLTLLAGVPLGVLQGRMQFGTLATVIVAGVGMRVAATIGLVSLGLGIGGAILATVLAQAAVLLLALYFLRLPPGTWARARTTLSPFRGEVLRTALGLSGFWFLAEADIVLARHYLDGENAGVYSVASVLAQTLLFLPAAVSVVALPRFAQDRRMTESTRWLVPALRAVTALVLIGFVGLVVLRGVVVDLAFGDRFRGSAGLVPFLAVAAGLLAVTNLLVYFHVAAGTNAHVFLFAGLALEFVLIGRFHESPTQIAVVAIGVTAVVALLLLHAAVARARSQTPCFDRRSLSPRAGKVPGLGEAAVELSVVLPCHNGADDLARLLEAIVRQLSDLESHEVIVVSDGSTDATVEVATAFSDRGVRVLHYTDRVGKGHALRVGLSEANGRHVAFLDADGDIDPASLRGFVELMRMYDPDIVLGSKRHPLSDIRYPLRRRVLSWGYHKLTRLLFRVNVRDTQTGCKLIRRDVLEAVLPRMVERRFAFDLELLVVARTFGFTKLFEAPVRIEYQFSSHVDASAVVRLFLDTVAIFYRRYVLNVYRDAPSARRKGRPRLSRFPSRLHAAGRRVEKRSGLRVLVVNWRDVGNAEAGGAEAYTHEVTRRWAAWGHEVTLLTSRFPGCRPVEEVDGVTIHRIGRLRTGTFHARVQLELARVRGYDVVIDEINAVPFLTPLWQRRLPPVIALTHQMARDVWDAELPRPVAALGRWVEPRLLRLYRDLPVVTVSDSTRRDLEALGLSRVRVVHGGLDAPPLAPAADKEPAPTFLFVGRLTGNKRPDHAVEAFRLIKATLPDARLWVVGRGPLESALAADLPAGAELLGYLPRDELYERMARAHCLLVPSVREGWGLVVIEASSVGTPVVGYDVPGIRDSVRHGETGLLARASDPDALARVGLELLASPSEYAAIRRSAIAWARRFSWERTAQELLAVVREAVNDQRQAELEHSENELAPSGIRAIANVAMEGR